VLLEVQATSALEGAERDGPAPASSTSPQLAQFPEVRLKLVYIHGAEAKPGPSLGREANSPWAPDPIDLNNGVSAVNLDVRTYSHPGNVLPSDLGRAPEGTPKLKPRCIGREAAREKATHRTGGPVGWDQARRTSAGDYDRNLRRVPSRAGGVCECTHLSAEQEK
jgi:hypothetical protein